LVSPLKPAEPLPAISMASRGLNKYGKSFINVGFRPIMAV
jgi:hypothetical protein